MTSLPYPDSNMEYGYVSSPSQSPNQSIFAAGQYFDSTSESSSPDSPHVSMSIPWIQQVADRMLADGVDDV